MSDSYENRNGTILFSGSVYENISYGRLGASREEVMEAAKMAGAHEFISGSGCRVDVEKSPGQAGKRDPDQAERKRLVKRKRNQKEMCMKIAVVTDSNSGVTQEEARRLGMYVVPMPFIIDGKILYEGIDLNHEQFFEKMNEGADISTSQPSPADVTGLWDEILKEYDQIVHIPMSSGLSGACQTAMMLSEDYEGRVLVVNNQRISVTQRQSALDAMELARLGWTGEQIKEKLEETRFDSSIYITVDTLKYLKKGGRITPAAAVLGTLLKIKPILTIQGEKLDAFAKARTMKQAKTIMLTALDKDLRERMKDPKAEHTYLEIAYTCDEPLVRDMEQTLMELYPGASVFSDPLSLSVSCHIGPGALAVACTSKLKELE